MQGGRLYHIFKICNILSFVLYQIISNVTLHILNEKSERQKSYLVRMGVTEVKDTKSQAKFLHIAFPLVVIGIFQLFGTKCGYSLTYW